MDPYNLTNPTNPVDARDIFENFEENQSQIQEPYIIQSDKIIYFTDGKLSIKELITDNSDDWVEYLRKKLKDNNSITAPSKKTIEFITDITSRKNYNQDKKKLEGKILKWELESDDKSVRLTVVDYNYRKNRWNDKKKQLEILPSFYRKQPLENYIIHCDILENDDLITITRIGIFIWTYRLSEIKMHYYWNDCNSHLVYFDFEKRKLKDLLIPLII
ncbi:hypothetical protein C2G38_1513243 [Gigaspora rosea]|uniref:Uncharacterized protein n=1 Tax=Gigaspora rosea TaxID=44941 RepID=A0A397W448_9GLOM|nr:hypothetical protein C2G38_1513243 [Gigaspora rosea]